MISSNLDPDHSHLTKNLNAILNHRQPAQCGMQIMSLKARQHLLWASMSHTDRYGQKIHSHWKQAASHRCCWQITVAGHRQTRQEERRAPALHLMERTQAYRRRGPGIQLEPRKSQREPLGGTAQPKELLLCVLTSPWNQPTVMQRFVNEDSVCALAACECSLTADACLPASPTNPL